MMPIISNRIQDLYDASFRIVDTANTRLSFKNIRIFLFNEFSYATLQVDL